MRYAGLILLFFLFRLQAQTGPPELRCLDVQPDGSVVLTWLPPADAGNNFSHYEIYYSAVSKTGPYSKITPTVAPRTATSAAHSSTTAIAQSSYYYMRSVSKNNTSSSSSDTLRTIFLNIFIGDPALQLTYNHLRAPRLTGSAATFTITKEYPPGSLNDLAVTPQTDHRDVISVCDAKINYQVLNAHSSGCVSKSNIVFGLYTDTKDPDTTYVDSISVLPDGRTTIAWTVSYDMDVDTYLVIKGEPGASNRYIDVVSGRNSTSYTYDSTEANNKAVSLYISALDSCANKPGPFDQRPVTMHLATEYDHCAYRTHLVWNHYQGMKGGIKEYRLYCSVAGGAFSRIGSTTDNSFTHTDVPPGKDLCYFVRVVNNNQSITASSNRSCFFSREVNIPSSIYLVSAAVNETQDVSLEIRVETQQHFASLDLLRSEQGTTGFSQIATLPFTGEEFYDYTDQDAETELHPYYYKVVLRDSCGNARGTSNISRTIFLRVISGKENVFSQQLTWTPYLGFAGGIDAYRVYRIVNGNSNPPVIAETPSNVNTYTDNLENVAAEGASIAYMVEAVEGTTSVYPVRATSTSNRWHIYVEGRLFVPNAFAPRGVNKTWKPVSHFVDKTDYELKIFDRWGHLVFEAHDDETAWDGGNMEPGVYVYLITYRNARGEYKQQKGSVVML